MSFRETINKKKYLMAFGPLHNPFAARRMIFNRCLEQIRVLAVYCKWGNKGTVVLVPATQTLKSR
jgi:hypothetical protein